MAPDSGEGNGGVRRRSGRRAEILKTAARLFAANGYHATSMADLTEAAGVGKGALYHHIGSKEKLLYDISAEHVIEMVEYGTELLETDLSAVEKLRRLSRRLMRTIAENLPELTVFFSEHRALDEQHDGELKRMRERFEEIWAQILAEGHEAGVFRTAEPLTVKAILGCHNYAYLWLNPEGPLTPEEISDMFCDLLLGGLLTPQAARTRIAL
jgi:AcrR family transcriptional regulator